MTISQSVSQLEGRRGLLSVSAMQRWNHVYRLFVCARSREIDCRIGYQISRV